TTSYYNYTGRVHRRFGHGLVWMAGFTGSHSGLTNQPGTVNHTEGYSTSFSMRRFTLTGNYAQASGNSVLTNGGPVPLPPTPGVPPDQVIVFSGSSYGGGLSVTPTRHFTISGTYNRALSNTLSNTIASRNNTEILNAQLQYHLRRIGLLAGYTRFTQG